MDNQFTGLIPDIIIYLSRSRSTVHRIQCKLDGSNVFLKDDRLFITRPASPRRGSRSLLFNEFQISIGCIDKFRIDIHTAGHIYRPVVFVSLSGIICNPYGNFIENTVILILSIEFNHERSVRTNFQMTGTSHNNFVTRKILLVNVIKCHVKRRQNELIYTD